MIKMIENYSPEQVTDSELENCIERLKEIKSLIIGKYHCTKDKNKEDLLLSAKSHLELVESRIYNCIYIEDYMNPSILI